MTTTSKTGVRRRPWTDAEVSVASHQYRSGVPAKVIARETGRTPNGIRLKMMKHGVIHQSRAIDWNRHEAKLRDLYYNKGLSIRQCSERMGLPGKRLRNRIKLIQTREVRRKHAWVRWGYQRPRGRGEYWSLSCWAEWSKRDTRAKLGHEMIPEDIAIRRFGLEIIDELREAARRDSSGWAIKNIPSESVRPVIPLGRR